MNCLLRAHFLTAETPDTFFVIIDRRVFPSISEIHSLFRNRTAFDTDAAADTFIWLDIWFFLKNIQSLCETLPHTGPCTLLSTSKYGLPYWAVAFPMVIGPFGVRISISSSFHVPSPIFSP